MSCRNLFFSLGPFLFLSLGWRGGKGAFWARLALRPSLRVWGPCGPPDFSSYAIHSARPGSPGSASPSPGVHPWTLLLSLLSDLCYSKFQQGDLEKTPLAPWRAPGLVFSRSRRRLFPPGDHQALSFAPPIYGAVRGSGAAPIVRGAGPDPASSSGEPDCSLIRAAGSGGKAGGPFPQSATMYGRRRVTFAGEEKWRGCASEWAPGTRHSHAAGTRRGDPNPRAPGSPGDCSYFYAGFWWGRPVRIGSVMREAARTPSKELNQELQRTKRQSVNLGTVGLCAQGPGLPRCKQKAAPCPARSWAGGHREEGRSRAEL